MESWFGVQRKDQANTGSAGLEFLERLAPFSELLQVRGEDWAETWLCRFGERQFPFSKLRIMAGSEFRERSGSNPGLTGWEFGNRPVSFL